MVARQTALLPLHQLLVTLDDWRADQTEDNTALVGAALEATLEAYGLPGAAVSIGPGALPKLDLALGSLRNHEPGMDAGRNKRAFRIGGESASEVTVWADGDADAVDAFTGSLELALEVVWARHQARVQAQQLEALDAAVRGIAAVQSVDAVLQLIVDRVRDLVSARYAALGIVGPFGHIEQFITSGLSHEQRDGIGSLPRGHGLLGLIIREASSFLIDDIAQDHRRYGFPPNHPEMHAFLGAPVRSRGRTIGNLYLTNKLTAPTFSEEDLRLVEMFALHAGIAMENASLHDEVQRLAIVDERQRISQDLHDSIIQSLYAVSLSLEDLPEIIEEDPVEAAARADRAIESIHSTIRDIRNFIFGLQPELLESADLPSGIRSMAAEFRANTLVELDVEIGSGLAGLPRDLAPQLLAITSEGLSNIAKHSRATRALLDLRTAGGVVRLTISDNGRGFDLTLPRTSSHHGLANLRSRAESAGGSLAIESQLGAGTKIVAEIPLRAND
ncbi:MAG: GAF domain-containing sensor histidine kinase [Candidatus Limnocylindrales bacterium]